MQDLWEKVKGRTGLSIPADSASTLLREPTLTITRRLPGLALLIQEHEGQLLGGTEVVRNETAA